MGFQTSNLQKERKRRLEHYDYSSNGAYFITFSTHENRLLFGAIRESDAASEHFAEMSLNDHGRSVQKAIHRACGLFSETELDSYAIMPNHVHLIIFVCGFDLDQCQKRTPLVSRFVAATKSHASRLIHETDPSLQVWNQNYYDHVIRDDKDLERIREYVANNPSKWALDKFYRDC